jgi:hypothetical protein
MAWKPIPTFPGYFVSDDGRVLSRKRKQPRLLSIATDREGRPLVALRQDGRLVTRRVHVLMLLAFVGPRPDGHVIRHLDGDPTNNILSNLAYGTHSDNGFDAVAHGTHVQASKTECAQGHPFSPENTYYRLDRSGRLCMQCRREAARRFDARKRGESLGLG